MRGVSQEQLKEILSYDKNTGVFTWIARVANSVKIGDIAGTHDSKGYIQISIKSTLYLAHRLSWLYVNGSFPLENIDHINGIRDDNRLVNLRSVNQLENSKNTKIRFDNKSGVIGVHLHKTTGKYLAYASHNKKMIHLGSFSNIEDAISARKEAEIKYNYHENHGRSK